MDLFKYAAVRHDGKTPGGGDYSEAFYLDAQHNLVDPAQATEIRINECLTDGTVIKTTYARIEQGE